MKAVAFVIVAATQVGRCGASCIAVKERWRHIGCTGPSGILIPKEPISTLSSVHGVMALGLKTASRHRSYTESQPTARLPLC